MPVLKEPQDNRSVTLPLREARIAGEADVLVVGGGPAGIGAAAGAARAGANVILVERYGFLGGAPAGWLVTPMASYYTHSETDILPHRFSLFPSDHGKGEPIAAGVLEEMVNRLIKMGGACRPLQENGYTVPFDPELFKIAAINLMDDAGVHVLLHATASGYITGENHGVVFETKSGPVLIKARTICDCTGDGDIAAWAGADYAAGRITDGYTQPMTLLFRVMDFNRHAFKEYTNNHPGEWDGVRGLEELIRKAAEKGDLQLPREDILFFGTLHHREVAVNCTRVNRVSGTSVWDLTRAEWEARLQMRQIELFFQRYVPGFEDSYIGDSGTGVCVRETRRILGDYILSKADVISAAKFEDAIARSTYPLDEHNPGGKGTLLKDVPYNDYYEIPLRCLLPKKLDTIVVGGRCISGSHLALSSYRVIPIAMITGQAAGVAAAVAAAKNISVHAVPYPEVRKILLSQNALI